MAAYLFLIYRVTSHRKQREIIIIIQREWKNGFPIDIRYRLHITIKHEPTQPSTNYTHSPKPCVSLKCHNPLVRKVTNLFKNTKFKITFPTVNKYITSKSIWEKRHLQNGIYNINSLTFNKTYDGQTGRKFFLRYLEHLQHTRNNNPHSAYAMLILNHEH